MNRHVGDPVDSDLGSPSQVASPLVRRWTLPAIALGGVVGALARHALDLAWPTGGPQAVPWTTFAINVIGSFLLGALVSGLTAPGAEQGPVRQLLRLLLGVGGLGGFTTFSTAVAQGVALASDSTLAVALAYLVGSAFAALAAAALGAALVDGLRGARR